MLHLQNLTTAHIPMLKQYLSAYPRQACDYSICNLITWGKIYNNQFALWQDRLVLINPKYQYVFFPVGEPLSPQELAELLKNLKTAYPEPHLILIPKEYRDANPAMEELFDLHEDRAWADYIYSTERMVQLSGKKLAKKKNLISQFRRAYPDYKVLPVTLDKREVILRFTEKWRREREVEGIYLHTEYVAIQNTMEMWDHIPIEGIIICLDSKIAAYSLFSTQTADMATVHFEKFDPDKKGSAQVINWETARHLLGRYQWINREQDIGLEGLRQAKMSYDPDFLVPFITGVPKF
jgi:hypothetical protein